MPAPGLDAGALQVLGAAVRSVQMAGGHERALKRALEHTVTCVQFNRPISNFQAIQHALAHFAGEAAAAGAAAAEAIATGAPLTDEDLVGKVAAAKIRVGEAASLGSTIAHQARGAMGFTYKLSLPQCDAAPVVLARRIRRRGGVVSPPGHAGGAARGPLRIRSDAAVVGMVQKGGSPRKSSDHSHPGTPPPPDSK